MQNPFGISSPCGRWCGKKDRGFAVLVGVRRCDESVLWIPVSPTEGVWEGARFLAKCFLGLGHGFWVLRKKGAFPTRLCGALAVRKRLCHYDSELCAQACFSKLS